MERSYSLWVAVSVATIVLVVAGFYVSLRNSKEQNGASPSPNASVTLEPTPTPSPSESPSPSSSPSATPSGGTINHREQGDAAYKAKDYMRAISEYTLAIQQASSKSDLAYLWNQLGNAYRDNQQPNEAINAYNKAIENNPKLGSAYLNKAAVLWGQGKKEEAKTVLRTGINNGATPKQDLQNTLDVYEAMSQ